ncbi:MAG TPA: TIGR00730 family Rossman fold protein, partial [Phycisphaerales bacterium]|nr:TIGR00730 family Rossman fold protein [Phycisphaerales bacterium]
MQRLAVYCASSDRIDDDLRLPAQSLGAALAQRGLELVYGGGSIGLMGEVARAAKANGGRVHGVITERLRDLEQGWEEADVLEVVPDMR